MQRAIGTAPVSRTKLRVQSFCRILPVSDATFDSLTAASISSGSTVSLSVSRAQRARPRKTRKARPSTSSRMSSRAWLCCISPVALRAALIQMTMTIATSQPESCLIEATTKPFRTSASPRWKPASTYRFRTQQIRAMRPSSTAQAAGVTQETKANFQVITCCETRLRIGSGQSVHFRLPGQPATTQGTHAARHKAAARAVPIHTAWNHSDASRSWKTSCRSGYIRAWPRHVRNATAKHGWCTRHRTPVAVASNSTHHQATQKVACERRLALFSDQKARRLRKVAASPR
mmetsp:Transcript_11233/g.33228  ORF Transcript_11233/g.33228 Transcript_11233/m.33228 type:complete len:289 (+) Transcript_11233:1235-2101(+)